VLLGAIHALAACAAFVALPVVPALVCAAGIALSAGVCVSGTLQWSRDSVRELALRPDGGVAWRGGDDAWHVAPEVSGGVLAPWLMVIGLKEDGRSLQPLLVLPDALDDEDRRELRVWLRWRPQTRRPAGMSVI
jgi:hypothetical protein